MKFLKFLYSFQLNIEENILILVVCPNCCLSSAAWMITRALIFNKIIRELVSPRVSSCLLVHPASISSLRGVKEKASGLSGIRVDRFRPGCGIKGESSLTDRSWPKDIVELSVLAEFPQQAWLTSCEPVNAPWNRARSTRVGSEPRAKLRVYNDNGERQGIHLRWRASSATVAPLIRDPWLRIATRIETSS